MQTLTVHKTDTEIQSEVLKELKWDSRFKASEIGVAVHEGIVTLTGNVENYPAKLAAREAAHRVAGVLDVADEIQVNVPGIFEKNDTELAQAVRNALMWDILVPEQKIRSTVSHGLVTLEGTVAFLSEKDEAEHVVRRLQGVHGVINRIEVVPPKVSARAVREEIEEALERRAEREANKIGVAVNDGVVTLTGKVRSWPEKDAVLGSVRHAPGVTRIDDDLRVDPFF
jgi:osmotically-inducible protein OsmY